MAAKMFRGFGRARGDLAFRIGPRRIGTSNPQAVFPQGRGARLAGWAGELVLDAILMRENPKLAFCNGFGASSQVSLYEAVSENLPLSPNIFNRKVGCLCC